MDKNMLTLLSLFITVVLMTFVINYFTGCSRPLFEYSEEVDRVINDFIANPETILLKTDDEYNIYFQNGPFLMMVWCKNWPYAYAAHGRIQNTQNAKELFRWSNTRVGANTKNKLRKIEEDNEICRS